MAERAFTPGPPLSRAVLHCRERDAGAVSAGLGVALPTEPLQAATTGSTSALHLGPEEWLLLGDLGPSPPTNVPHSLVDVGHRQVALLVEGRRAEDVLASGCPLDLAPAAFPVGMCTRTLFHKAQIVLWRIAPERFHLEVWRSFAPYVEALLTQAASDP